ncbi:MAG: DUF2062 domain-containing protein [Nitrospirae bacterium]|jgi:uncharacterized protein|nr:DUF2062 domain-containing protein [Nitrospirota bacterium]
MKSFARLKDYIIRVSKKGLSPNEIASAVSIGTFIACIPLIGIHTIIAIALASLLRLNTFVVLLGTQISNPLSFPFQLFISAEIGSLILNGHFLDIKFSKDINYVSHYIAPIIIGSLVLGITISILSYLLVKIFLTKRKVLI